MSAFLLEVAVAGSLPRSAAPSLRRAQRPLCGVRQTAAMGTDHIEPFELHITEAEITDLRNRLANTRWADPETVEDWSQGTPLAYVKELCEHWALCLRLRRGRGPVQRLPPVPNGHRRVGHPLPARPLAARRRPAHRDDPRLARLGGRVPRGDRPAGRPDRARRRGVRRVPRRLPVAARLRLERQADRGRMGHRADRSRLGRADGPARLRALRRPGRRLGRRRDGGARPARPRALHRHPPEHGPRVPRSGHDGGSHAGGAGLHRLVRVLRPVGLGLLEAAVHPPAERRLRAGRLAGRTARLDRREAVRLDGQRRSPGERARPGSHARQRDGLLAARHRARPRPVSTGRASPACAGA